MKIYLDLLPESRKERMRRRKKIKSIIKQEFLFFLPVAVSLAVLISISIILNINLEGMSSVYNSTSKQGNYQSLESYKEDFSRINNEIKYIIEYNDNHIRWSSLLGYLSESIPETIKITSLSTKDYRVFISGTAASREGLIELQEKFSGSECFSDVNIPLSNLVSRENVVFQMDMEANSDCLNGNQ